MRIYITTSRILWIVCFSYYFKGVNQEAIGLRLFPLLITREAIRWLAESPHNSITSWEEYQDAFLERFFPPLKIVKLRLGISNQLMVIHCM